MPSAASLAARAVAPNDSSAAASGRAAPPAPPLPPGSKPGVCNAYLPMTTTLDRYLWVVRYFVEQGFWVLIDYHTHLNEPALESPQALASNWLRLWRGLTALNSWEEELKGRVFLDVLNEPDEHRLGWDGPLPGSVHTASLADYYFAVMDAIHQESPGATLFFIQVRGTVNLVGCGQSVQSWFVCVSSAPGNNTASHCMQAFSQSLRQVEVMQLPLKGRFVLSCREEARVPLGRRGVMGLLRPAV